VNIAHGIDAIFADVDGHDHSRLLLMVQEPDTPDLVDVTVRKIHLKVRFRFCNIIWRRE